MSDLYLVTGGAGFIGSHIVQRLIRDGERVRVVDNLCTGSLTRLAAIGSQIEFVEGDLAEFSTCERALNGVDFVLHQAAIPSVQRSIRDPIASNRANVTAFRARKRGEDGVALARGDAAGPGSDTAEPG